VRSNGGFIGPKRVVTPASAAGIWAVQDAQREQGVGNWASVGFFESIATVTVGSGGQSTIVFSSIPSTYKHLQVRFMAQSNRSSFVDNLEMYVNSDQSANYSVHYLIGDGANAPSSTGAANASGFISTSQNLGSSSGTPNAFGVGVIDILDYSNTNKHKTLRGLWGLNLNTADSSSSFGRLGISSGNWRNANAISSITFYPTLGTSFTQYTSFALYGIKG
jgi:hypothetical protein